MREKTKARAATAGKRAVDASIIVLITMAVIGLLRENGVEISGASEELIIMAVVLVSGRVAAWAAAQRRRED